MAIVSVILMILDKIPASKGFQDTFHTASKILLSLMQLYDFFVGLGALGLLDQLFDHTAIIEFIDIFRQEGFAKTAFTEGIENFIAIPQ